MKEFIEQYNEALKRAEELFESKSKSYIGSDHIKDYWIHGIQDLVYEIYKKALRLTRTSKNGVYQNTDSIEDSAIDLINYSAFLYAYVKTLKEEESGDIN